MCMECQSVAEFKKCARNLEHSIARMKLRIAAKCSHERRVHLSEKLEELQLELEDHQQYINANYTGVLLRLLEHAGLIKEELVKHREYEITCPNVASHVPQNGLKDYPGKTRFYSSSKEQPIKCMSDQCSRLTLAD